MIVGWTILLIIFISYTILGWTLYFLQPKFMYRPVREVSYDPRDIGLTFEKISLKTDDSIKISAWYVPCQDASKTVLFCHGNGGNISHRLDTINILNEMGMNCFIFDYHGYGDSQGRTTEKTTYLDAEAAWDWLTCKKGISPDDIILFGRSMGGSIACYLASKVDPYGLVIESTFTSYVKIGQKFYPYLPVRLFAAFEYDTLEYIRNVSCPVLVMHSKADEIVPYEFSPILFDAVKGPRKFVELYGKHNNGFLFSGETYRQGWTQWLDFIEDGKKQSQLPLKKIS